MAAAPAEAKTTVVPNSAAFFLASDAKLVERKAELAPLHAKYSAPASSETIEKVAKVLTEKKFVVHVVADKAAALKQAQDLLGATASSFSYGGCQSLHEIGFVAWAGTQTTHTNYKAIAHANYGKPEGAKATAAGATSDWYFTTPCALSESGDLVWASATATRVSLWAKHTVFIVGAQKIVPTEADGLKRLYEYCKPLVGAATRALYGAPDTNVTETGILSSGNPFGPGQFHVILVKEVIGY